MSVADDNALQKSTNPHATIVTLHFNEICYTNMSLR